MPTVRCPGCAAAVTPAAGPSGGAVCPICGTRLRTSSGRTKRRGSSGAKRRRRATGQGGVPPAAWAGLAAAVVAAVVWFSWPALKAAGERVAAAGGAVLAGADPRAPAAEGWPPFSRRGFVGEGEGVDLDTRYLPPEAAGVLAVRPRELAAHPVLAAADAGGAGAAWGNDLLEPWGLTAAGTESIVLAVPAAFWADAFDTPAADRAAAGTPGGPAPLGDPDGALAVVRLTVAWDLAAPLPDGASPVRRAGPAGDYFDLPAGPGRPAVTVFPVDAKTLLVGSRESVAAAVARGPRRLTAPGFEGVTPALAHVILAPPGGAAGLPPAGDEPADWAAPFRELYDAVREYGSGAGLMLVADPVPFRHAGGAGPDFVLVVSSRTGRAAEAPEDPTAAGLHKNRRLAELAELEAAEPNLHAELLNGSLPFAPMVFRGLPNRLLRSSNRGAGEEFPELGVAVTAFGPGRTRAETLERLRRGGF